MLPWFTKYPNQNDEILNLDCVIRQVENLKEAYEAFLAANSLTFADPIVWDITTQYSKNTIVLSPEGDAYLSKKVVGKGIQLNNTDYWLEIFNFAEYVRTANSNLTVHIEQNTTRATAAYAVDDWLLWEDVLYKVTTAISVDDLLTVDTNIVHFTVEDFCRAWVTYGNNLINQYKIDIDASELAYKNELDASEYNYRIQLAGDISNTVASLQDQLDAAIAGATVDSEVINARVGVDGTIYSTLGEAIRTQIGDILTLFEINQTVDLLLSYSIDNVGFVTSDTGALNTNSYFRHTDYIDVEGLKTITVSKSITHVCAFYDANKNYVSGVNSGTPSNIEYTVTVPDTAKYVIFNGSLANIEANQYTLTAILDSAYVDILSKLHVKSNSLLGDINFYDKYINTDGTLGTNSDFSHTDFIDVSGCKTIVITKVVTIAGCWYDKRYNYISNIDVGSASNIQVEVSVPDNAYYAIVNVIDTNLHNNSFDVLSGATKEPYCIDKMQYVSDFKNEDAGIWGDNIFTFTGSTDGYYIKCVDGSTESTTSEVGFGYSDYIDVSEYDYLQLYKGYTYSGVGYDGSYNVVKGFNAKQDMAGHVIYVGDVDYIRLNYATDALTKSLFTVKPLLVSNNYYIGKNVMCLGDSIFKGKISGSENDANPTISTGIMNILNIEAYNYGVSGTSICNGSPESFVTRLNDCKVDTFDMILIFGGTNDYGDLRATSIGSISDSPAAGTNFTAAFKYLITNAIAKYPEARICVVTPLRRDDGEAPNANGITMGQIVEAEKNVAKLYACPVLDLYNTSNIDPTIAVLKSLYASDGLHPSQYATNRILIPMFVNFIKSIL